MSKQGKTKLADMSEAEFESAVPFEKFSAPDKRKVVDLLFSNEDVLIFLYEVLFP